MRRVFAPSLLAGVALLLALGGRGDRAGAAFIIFAKAVVVNTTVDEDTAPNGQCSLREAIKTVNAGMNTGGCTFDSQQLGDFKIEFNITGGGTTPTIGLVSALPQITKTVLINGNTGGATRVVVHGPGTLAASGIVLTQAADQSAIESLVLQNFQTALLVQAPSVLVRNNYIGTNAAGTSATGNANLIGIQATGDGIVIGGTTDVNPSGPCTGDCNLISGNSSQGIVLAGSNAVVRGNFIGTDASGTAAIFNNTGVVVGGQSATIGGSGNAGNLISGNSLGLEVSANPVTISGNRIGTNAAQNAALSNGFGVWLEADGADLGVTGGAPNVISGNAEGVRIRANSNTIVNNIIGATESGAHMGNAGNGIFIEINHLLTDIGLGASGGNTVAFNGTDGIFVNSSALISIRGNSIFSNVGKGIKLHDANDQLQPPVITAATASSVTGTATLSNPPGPCTNCTIDVYSDDEDEGRIYEGSTATNGSGVWTFNGTLHGPGVTATTNDVGGDTSEFSLPYALPATPTPTPSPSPSPTPTGSATDSATPTHSATPTPTHSPTPSPTSSATQKQGDFNCDGSVNETDYNFQLLYAAGLNNGLTSGSCPNLGDPEAVSGFPWGDVNCDGHVDLIDVLYVVAFKAGITLPPVAGNCFPIGQAMT